MISLSNRIIRWGYASIPQYYYFLIPIFLHSKQLVRSSFWRDQWNHYKNICSLVDKTNEGFSVLIILSYSINLYIICVQLLNIFKWVFTGIWLWCIKTFVIPIRPITSKVQGAYLWYSLFHIIVKTLFVSLYASKIHDESKKSVSFFRTIPNECFTEDVSWSG